MTRLRLIFSEALRSIGANLSTTFASVVSVLIGMVLIGVFVGIGTWLVSWSDDKKRELAVHVYVTDDGHDEADRPASRAARVGSARQAGRHHVHHQGRGARDHAQAQPGAHREPRLEPAARLVRRHPQRERGHPEDALAEKASSRRGRGALRRGGLASGSFRSRAQSRSCRSSSSSSSWSVYDPDRRHDPTLDLRAAA